MRSWKTKTRADHKRQYQQWKNSNSDNWQPWGLKLWRKRWLLRYNQSTKTIKYGLKKFAEHMYCEDCRAHPCLVTKIETDYNGGRLDIEVKSLVNGVESSCSYFHCGIVHLTEADAHARADFIKLYGMTPYSLSYRGEPPSKEQLVSSLRYQLGMERVWGFNSNQKVDDITDKGKQWMVDKYEVNYDDLVPMTDEEMKESLEEA
jgi:hypothetical protein